MTTSQHTAMDMSQSQNAAPVDPHSGSPSPPLVPLDASRTSQILNAMPVELGRTSLSLNATPEEASRTLNSFPGEGRPSKSLNMMSIDATRNPQLSPVDVQASALHNVVPLEVSRTSKSLNVMPVELERASQLLLVPAEASDDDVRTIKEVLSVHHVPVVASLHWEKLHTILHTLCDRIAIQALRIEKAEEQGKIFLGFKDELDQLW